MLKVSANKCQDQLRLLPQRKFTMGGPTPVLWPRAQPVLGRPQLTIGPGLAHLCPTRPGRRCSVSGYTLQTRGGRQGTLSSQNSGSSQHNMANPCP